MNRFLVVMLLTMISYSCEQHEKKIDYYDNGKPKIVEELSGGKRHGSVIEYYPTGKVKSTGEWRNGVQDGTYNAFYSTGKRGEVSSFYRGKKIGKRLLFYESGLLLEEQEYDSLGRLINVKSYLESGDPDFNKVVPVFYLANDSINLGELNTLTINLCNADTNIFKKGKLFITSAFNNEKLTDTLAIVESQSRQYTYGFKTSKIGRNQVLGRVIYYIPVPDNDSLLTMYTFDVYYPFYVKDTIGVKNMTEPK